MHIFASVSLNPSFPIKYNLNRFTIAWTIRPHAGLSLLSFGFKVMADCCLTHHTSLFLRGLHICYVRVFVYIPKIMMFPSLPLPEWVVPIFSLATTDNGQMCGEHHYGCSSMLLLKSTAPSNFGGFLHQPKMELDKLAAFCCLWQDSMLNFFRIWRNSFLD